MYTPPFIVTDEILHLVSEISEQIGTLSQKISTGILPSYRTIGRKGRQHRLYRLYAQVHFANN